MATRLCGALMLAIATIAINLTAQLVATPPHHQPTALEMLLALATVVALVSGGANLIVGPALFRPYRWPPHSDGDATLG